MVAGICGANIDNFCFLMPHVLNRKCMVSRILSIQNIKLFVFSCCFKTPLYHTSIMSSCILYTEYYLQHCFSAIIQEKNAFEVE